MEPIEVEPIAPAGGRAANWDFVWEQSGFAYTLRLNRRRWEDLDDDHLGWPALVVFGSWLILSWARFGSHAITAPRAVTRFVLVGVYGWIGLTVVFWLVARFRGPVTLQSGAAAVGRAHQPLLFAALTLQIFQILLVGPLNTLLAIGAAVWMAGQVNGALAFHQRRPAFSALPGALAVWIPWAATAGYYLWLRLSHLI